MPNATDIIYTLDYYCMMPVDLGKAVRHATAVMNGNLRRVLQMSQVVLAYGQLARCPLMPDNRLYKYILLSHLAGLNGHRI